MNRFWTDVTLPLAQALKPKTIVEIGSDEGAGTEKLLHFCQKNGATLHVIDPLPSYDIQSWRQRWGKTLAYHEAPSLDVLTSIAGMDLVFVDGDHNWHTVREELEAIHQATVGDGGAFPLVLLHDVAWPYGRRDLYYAPERIPETARQPHATAGMLPGQSELVPGGGYNPHRFNAVHEGGPRNGVLTAVDDFIADHASEPYELIVLRILFGLGILYRKSDARPPALDALLAALRLDQRSENLVALAEGERVAALIDAQEKEREVDVLQLRLDAAERLIGNDQTAMGQISNRLVRSSAQLTQTQSHLAHTQSQLAHTQAQLGHTQAQLAQADATINDLRSRVAALEAQWSAWESSRMGRAVAYIRARAARHPRLAHWARRSVSLLVRALRKLKRIVRQITETGRGVVP